MTRNGLLPAVYIDSSEALREVVNHLLRVPLVALDTESNSLHAYQGRVCLIQVSTRTADYIIDPLTVTDMRPLGEVLANPHIEKVFHAAEYDVISFRREYQFEVANLFDTSLAARLCREANIGLADLLFQHFEVVVDKRHQLDDWSKRPLSEASLLYAQLDTHYLPGLRDRLRQRLEKNGQLLEALEIFADVAHIDAGTNGFDPEGYWKLGKPGLLTRRQMAHLRELYQTRDALAQQENVPVYRIVPNGLLVEIARRNPSSLRELSEMDGLAEWQIRVYGEPLLAALERGRSSRLPHPLPRSNDADPIIAERYMQLHAWRKQQAARRGIDANLIVSRRVLREIATRMPATLDALAQIPGIGPWRLEQYGPELLAVIARMRR